MNRAICKRCPYHPELICWTQPPEKNKYYQIICFNLGNRNAHFANITADMDGKLYWDIVRSAKPKIQHPELSSVNLLDLDESRDGILKKVEINEKCPYYVEQML